MAYLSPIGNEQQNNANGDPLSGGKIHTYAAGTWTATGAATGETERRGVITYEWTTTGAAGGSVPRSALAAGAWTVDGAAAGHHVAHGAAEGTWTVDGNARGPRYEITATASLNPPRWTGHVLSGPPRAAAVLPGRWATRVERN